MSLNISKIFKVYEINSVYSANKIKKTEKLEEKNDMIEISNNAKDFQKVINELKKIPDIREDKVKELKQKINNKEYKVNSNILAEKIIENILL